MTGSAGRGGGAGVAEPASGAWPLFGLRLRTPRLELRVPQDDELAALMEVARLGVHDPSWTPFLVPWTDLEGDEFTRNFLQYHWGCRAEWTPQAWRLELAVFCDGHPIGAQSAVATDFAVTRAVSTGSWLGRAWQGRGIGTEMRAAVLELAFAGLGADVAFSGAFDRNLASQRVSEKLGYRPNGFNVNAVRGAARRELRFVIERQGWTPPIDVAIEGLDDCRALLGV